MTAPAGVLDLPAERGARRLALGYLDEAEAAHQRLERADDDEALHDFRVAVRRLRSTVRAYRDYLRDSIDRRDRERLGALADETGDARDLEVQVSWLERRLDMLPRGEGPGDRGQGTAGEPDGHERARAWELLNATRAARNDARDRLLRHVNREFPRERWRLARSLRFYLVRVDLEAPPEGPRLAAVLARLALAQAVELEERLAQVQSIDDQEPAHRARIAAKRLRYLLEPVQADLEGAPGVIRALKKLQDALGEMHDADVLLARIAAEAESLPADGDGAPVDGFATLRRMLEGERAARFGQVEAGWLHGRAAGFFEAVRGVALAAASWGDPGREIERKYLLKRMPAIRRLPGVEVLEVEQGYVPGEQLVERLRRTRKGGEVKYYRTVKLGRGISRIEVEEETDEHVFRRLWPLTKGKRVRKMRYKVREGGFTWEIDRFRDRRLVLCEVELPTEDTHAEPPRWLAREIVRDVTDESEYTNLNLAK